MPFNIFFRPPAPRRGGVTGLSVFVSFRNAPACSNGTPVRTQALLSREKEIYAPILPDFLRKASQTFFTRSGRADVCKEPHCPAHLDAETREGILRLNANPPHAAGELLPWIKFFWESISERPERKRWRFAPTGRFLPKRAPNIPVRPQGPFGVNRIRMTRLVQILLGYHQNWSKGCGEKGLLGGMPVRLCRFAK